MNEYKLVQEVEIAREQEIYESIEKIVLGGELDEVIEGQTRKYWYAFFADEFVSDEFIANLIDPRLDPRDTRLEAIQNASNKICAEMRGDI